LNVLGEIEVDSRELLGKLCLQLGDQLVLGHLRRPLIKGLEGREELGIVEAGGITAVIGAAVLGNHRDHFGVAKQDLPHPGHVRETRIERDGRGHRGPDPEIALFQMR
jgi:hypothetical protein